MSYILDALKKLESEKSKKTRSDGVVNIAGALLRDEPRRTSSRTAWKVGAIVVVASLATFAATWYFLHADKRHKRFRLSRAVQPPPVVSVAPPAVPPPATPVPQTPPVSPPAAPAAVPVTAPAKAPATPATPAASPVPHTKPRAAVPSAPMADDEAAGKQAAVPKRHGKQVRPVAEERPVARALSAPPADIKVSGIAWQDERGARRAVVNGFLVHEGSVVSGARITEIFKDRVRFTSGDQVFEAPLLMTVSPAAGK
jgi:general secretion pathway protein B